MEKRETLGKVIHQAYEATQFVSGYGFFGPTWVQMGNAQIAKVCQAPVNVPIDGRIDAAKLIDRMSDIVRDVSRLKRVIAHALD